jgi:hypothetical protein
MRRTNEEASRNVANRTQWRCAAKLAALALCLLALAAPAFAWNDEGHLAVAYLAYQRLQPATRARANALLKLNPYYSKWRAMLPTGISDADADQKIFMIAATWPDQIRSDPTYMDDGPNGGNSPPQGPEATRNMGYSDHLRHKYWHFIDIFWSQDGTKLPPIPSPNAETQIHAFRRAIASNASDDVKAYDLAWLEHLVGDVHQPLHAITRVNASMPNGDAGGSLLRLCAAPCSDNLHLFWDRLVGSQSGIAYPGPNAPLQTEAVSAIKAAQALPAPDPNLVPKTDEHVWLQESFDLGKQYVYVGPVGTGLGPITLTAEYYGTAKRIAEQRVALAGARLGNLLNRELK